MTRSLVVATLALLSLSEALAADAVTLVSAGEGARKVIRLGPGSGAPQQATMVLDSSSSTKMMGQDVVVDAPAITSGLDLTAKPADAGAFSLAFAWHDVTVAKGDELGTMTAKKAASQMTGVKGSMKVTDTGRVLEQHTEGSGDDGFDLELWIPRLPTEAVGLGASWTWSSQETDDKGFTWTETTTYKLVSLDEARATLQIETTRKSGAGKMQLEGMSVPVSGIVETGTGTAVVRLDQPFPEAGAWHLDTITSATLMGQPVKLASKLDVRLGATR
jgi:hypothetical protein